MNAVGFAVFEAARETLVSPKKITFGSVCSGIEAASQAWLPLGWECAFVSEIDPFACHVLHHRHGASRPRSMPSPDEAGISADESKARITAMKAVAHLPEYAPGCNEARLANAGDFRTIQKGDYEAIDVLIGGTPCQSFSTAGLRAGLNDGRGNLALEFLRLAERLAPDWVVWENVPGILSSNGGRDFGAIVGTLGELGYGVAYRILDAQHFGVPQQRRRVFVIGHRRHWACAGKVLFEQASFGRDSVPCREEGETVAALTATGVGASGPDDNQAQAGHLIVTGYRTTGNDGIYCTGDKINSLTTNTDRTSHLIGFHDGVDHSDDMGLRVRRLMPVECERLQGFPDNYTMVPYKSKRADQCADGPRYRVIGNSMAVPVIEWIGKRIEWVMRNQQGKWKAS